MERNERELLDAAAAVFSNSGVNAPVREVAAAAGVGVATLYRHFPTRSDLVVAVYRHQIAVVLFKGFGGANPDRGVPAATVVEALEVVEDRELGFAVAGEPAVLLAGEDFLLRLGKQALGHAVEVR